MKMALIEEEIKANLRLYCITSGLVPMPAEREIVGEMSSEFR